MLADPKSQPSQASLDPLTLIFESSGVVLAVLLILIVASTLVWLIWFLKSTQLSRLRAAQHRFEEAAARARTAKELIAVALEHRGSPGGRVVIAVAKQQQDRRVTQDYLLGVARRAVAGEEERASSLMPTLSSIASASPFIGLFGTVWGIMNAFLRIGVEKSASLPVVAPAIGEALIATAVGLLAAIPATIAYNYVDRRIGSLQEQLGASAEAWVAALVQDHAPTSQLTELSQSTGTG